MREQARYVNHRGQSIELNSGDIHLNTGTLNDWAYTPEIMGGKVAYLSRDLSSRDMGAVVVGYETRNRVYRVISPDNAAQKPGRLYIRDGYLECYLIASNKANTSKGPAAEYAFTIQPASEPRWVRVHDYSFLSSAAGGGMDFDYDFDYDFDGAVAEARVIENPSAIPAPVVITVYGPAKDPSLAIAGNVYKCECEIETGGRLVIDGAHGTITLYDRWGAAQDAFESRRGVRMRGSGSYVFEDVPEGTHAVVCREDLNVAIELRELRDEWEWLE